MRSFKNENLEEFGKTMKLSVALEACGVVDEKGQFREFTPEEEKELGIATFSLDKSTGESTPGVVQKKPYCRPGSRLTVYYG